MTEFGRIVATIALILAVTFAAAGTARADGTGDRLLVLAALDLDTARPTSTAVDVAGRRLVLRVQRRLRDFGLYPGPLDGRVTPVTAWAIRLYQRQTGLPLDGAPSRALLEELESTTTGAYRLLQRLETARERQIREAWRALGSRMPAGELAAVAAGSRPAVAAATQPTACFAAPTPGCLLDAARAAALAVREAEFRDTVLGELATAQAAAGDEVAALAAAGRIADPRLLIATLGGIARAQAGAGDYAAARLTARAIPDDRLRAESLTAIAAAQLTGGDLRALEAIVEGPLAAVGAVTISGSQALLLGEFAGVRAKLGNRTGALAPAHVHTAVDEAETGDVVRALATDEAVGEPRHRAIALQALALAQARKGARAAARATQSRARLAAEAIEHGYARAYSLGRIARAQAEIGAVDGAFETAKAIDDAALRARALWTVALFQAGLGDWAAARRSETLAEAASAEIGDALDRVWLLGDIALLRQRAGDVLGARAMFDRALDRAASLFAPGLRARALSKLAVTLVGMRRGQREARLDRP